MARPKKDNLDYFPHDTRASADERLEIFEIKYPDGLGYAWFFKSLERIYYHQGKLDISEAETRQILCKNLPVNPDEIIEYAVKIGLFDKKEYQENNVLTSDRIKKNVNPIILKREKMAKNYQKQVSEAETVPETGEETHIVKESKEKEINTIYSLYPSRDLNNDNKATGKCSKNKDKIKTLLKTIPAEKIIETINWYVSECDRTKTYLKNFGTFLNNMPEIPDEKESPKKKRVQW